MQSYLFTCSNSKQWPNEQQQLSVYFDEIESPTSSSLEVLSFSDELFDVRKEIIAQYQQKRDILLWEETLPAWQLYSGTRAKFFPCIKEKNWKKEGFELLIFSTLFGWVKHTDRLPYYELDLDKKPIFNFSVRNFWATKRQELLKCIPENSIDLLPNTYREIFNQQGSPIGIETNIKWTDRGDQKGHWLNQQLDLLP